MNEYHSVPPPAWFRLQIRELEWCSIPNKNDVDFIGYEFFTEWCASRLLELKARKLIDPTGGY